MATKTRKPQLTKQPTSAALCLIPNCRRPAKLRGLCAACLQAFYRSVRSGELTEAQAIEQRLVLPKSKAGRKRSPWSKAAARIEGSTR